MAIFALPGFTSPSSTFGNSTIESAGSSDIFLLEYSPDGELNWVLSAGSTAEDYPEDMATNLAGETYITGFFNSNILTFGDTELYHEGEWDVFIAKIGNTLGVHEDWKPSDFQIYPNPIQRNKAFQSNIQWNNATLIFQNMLGETVYQVHHLSDSYMYALPEYMQAGVYIVQAIEVGQLKARSKVIVID